MPAAAAISNDDIRRVLAGRGSAPAWASASAPPPPGIAPATAEQLWATLHELAVTEPEALTPAQWTDMTVLLRSPVYVRGSGPRRRRQWWAVIATYRAAGFGARMLGVCTYANSTDQNPGPALSVGTAGEVDDVIDTFNELCAAKRAGGYRARRREGSTGQVDFSRLAAAVAAAARSS